MHPCFRSWGKQWAALLGSGKTERNASKKKEPQEYGSGEVGVGRDTQVGQLSALKPFGFLSKRARVQTGNLQDGGVPLIPFNRT